MPVAYNAAAADDGSTYVHLWAMKRSTVEHLTFTR